MPETPNLSDKQRWKHRWKHHEMHFGSGTEDFAPAAASSGGTAIATFLTELLQTKKCGARNKMATQTNLDLVRNATEPKKPSDRDEAEDLIEENDPEDGSDPIDPEGSIVEPI